MLNGELQDKAKRSNLPSSVRRPNVRLLTLAVLKNQTNLQTYCGSKTEFNITFVAGFNRLFIRPVDSINVEMLIQDEIIDLIDSGCRFKETPSPNMIAVAHHPKDGNHHRVVVQHVAKKVAKVQYIDVGNTEMVEVKDLRPASLKLLEYSALAYEVKLAGIDEDKDLDIAFFDILEMMAEASTTLFLESCSKRSSVDSTYIVGLRPKNVNAGDTISKRILRNSKWEWERLYEQGYQTEAELFQNCQDSKLLPSRDTMLKMRIIPPGTKLQGKISSIRSASPGSLSIVAIKNDEQMVRELRILESHMRRYAEKVIPPRPFYFPMFNEVVMVFIPDVPALRRVLQLQHGIGKWNRCFMASDDNLRYYLHNVDYDEVYVLDTEYSQNFMIRKVPPEFCEIPVGTLRCIIKDFKPSSMTKPVGTDIAFTVHDLLKKTQEYVISIDEV